MVEETPRKTCLRGLESDQKSAVPPTEVASHRPLASKAAEFGLEVPVDDPLRVRGVQPLGHLHREGEDLPLRGRATGDHLAQRLPL